MFKTYEVNMLVYYCFYGNFNEKKTDIAFSCGRNFISNSVSFRVNPTTTVIYSKNKKRAYLATFY